MYSFYILFRENIFGKNVAYYFHRCILLIAQRWCFVIFFDIIVVYHDLLILSIPFASTSSTESHHPEIPFPPTLFSLLYLFFLRGRGPRDHLFGATSFRVNSSNRVEGDVPQMVEHPSSSYAPFQILLHIMTLNYLAKGLVCTCPLSIHNACILCPVLSVWTRWYHPLQFHTLDDSILALSQKYPLRSTRTLSPTWTLPNQQRRLERSSFSDFLAYLCT